jgi:hypothetical protein
MNSLFDKAIKQLLPRLDESLKREVKDKVLAHLLESFKEKVYQNDMVGLEQLQIKMTKSADIKKRSVMYGRTIMQKYSRLTKPEQKKINEEVYQELTRVMHQIYLAAS